MYDYRRMTPEERNAVVEHRRSRGFPLHKPPHPDQGEGWYLITAATYEHRPRFPAVNELTALANRLVESFSEAAIECGGWVVFPNHYHALVRCQELRVVGRTVGRVHGRSSRYANLRDGTPGRKVWYQYTDRKMRSDRHYMATLHYVAFNPVKHGYVDEMRDWPWSSIHELIGNHGRSWIDDMTNRYPIGDYGDAWDSFDSSANCVTPSRPAEAGHYERKNLT